MKKLPMMLQLSCIMIGVMVLPTIILTWYNGNQILWHSEQEIAESSLAELMANRKLNENALNNISQDAVRLSATNIFDRIRPFKTYEDLSSNSSNIRQAMGVLRELMLLNRRSEGVYSSYFYLQGADYIVSTDRSITSLERYESLDWIQDALENQVGIGGVWYPRKLSSGIQVVSYVLPLNRLSTTTKGTLVVNLLESQMENYLSSSSAASRGYSLVDRNGLIISHNDKSVLHTKTNEFVPDMLASKSSEGFDFRDKTGERLLYTWSYSDHFEWMTMSVFSVHDLMTKTHEQQRNMIILMIIIIFAGVLVTVYLAIWLSKPARELVRKLNRRGDFGLLNRNEFTFLDIAFKRMQEEEEELHQLLKVREQDTHSLAVHQLLRGEISKQISCIFPYPYYLVIAISIDRYRQYVRKHNLETRGYHRYQLSSCYESVIEGNIKIHNVYQGEGCFLIIVNYHEAEKGSSSEELGRALEQLKQKSVEILGHTVTIGVSSRCDEAVLVSERAGEAMEAVKHRMISGSGEIHYWQKDEGRVQKYMYPTHGERRIINFLDQGNLDNILNELELIQKEIRAAEYISYDNILFIYNQLVGATIRHVRENHVSVAKAMSGRSNIYSMLHSLETLDELQDYLHEFYSEMLQMLKQNEGESNHYGERITSYLREHYCEEVIFEDMAKEIGISYSYMRKIVYEMNGTSLIDYLNMLRVEKAKQLLNETNLPITEIAAQVGYENARNFNRFFRKYEGMAPSNYRSSNRNS